MTSSRYKWVVWWYETNAFDGKVQRHYRDFKSASSAKAFRCLGDGRHYGPISACPWHHRNNPGLLGTWSKVEKL